MLPNLELHHSELGMSYFLDKTKVVPVPKNADIGCSFCRLIRRPDHLIGKLCGMSRKTKVHSFGDHLISESLSVTPLSVIETSIVLCSVSL
jgi:hypothetical protein